MQGWTIGVRQKEKNEKETKEVFISIDGNIYNTEEECLRHEESLKSAKAYKIFAKPDLTEGRHGVQFVGYLLVVSDSAHSLLVEDWCYTKYGRRIDFVMGARYSHNAMEVWKFEECSIDKVDNAEVLETIMVN